MSERVEVYGEATLVEVAGSDTAVIEHEHVLIIDTGTQGPPGLPGPTGPPGLPGSAPQAHRHVQNVPSTSWGPILHGLGYRPAGIEISDNTVPPRNVEGEVVYDAVDPLNKLTLTFLDPIAGVADFS